MTRTLVKAAQLLTTEELWTGIGQTMQAWALGMVIALVLAVPTGIALGSNHLLFRSVRLIIEFLRPIPSVALIPLAILIAGTGITSKVGLAVFGAFWPLLVQCYYGMQDVDPVAQDTARSFRLGRLERFRRVSLPSAVPYIATGARIASAVVLIVVVSAEIVIGAPGLGRQIYVAQSAGAYEMTYAVTLLIGVLAWILSIGVSKIERRVLHWHPSQRLVAA
jgi:ABC-type nitrate/sulfonate/bicarbonate transport system permease component